VATLIGSSFNGLVKLVINKRVKVVDMI